MLEGTRTPAVAIKSKLVPDVTVGVFAPEPMKLTARTLLPTVKLLVVLSNVKLELAPKLPPSLNCNCVLIDDDNRTYIVLDDDFEYFTDEFGKRLLSFCYYAGVVGCHYGLLYTDRVIDKQTIQIAIIGNGKCSKGVQDVLHSLSLPFKVIGRNKDGIDFTSFDIIYNCILLEKTNNEVWFDEHTTFTKPLLIVDVSCDYTKPNNPIKIYSTPTTFERPIQKYGDFVKIIAIENLPSIVPEKSSIYFSKKCKDLLLNADVDVWERCGKAFLAC
jgi:hypothetical protein